MDKDISLWQDFLDGQSYAYARIYELYAKQMYYYGLRFSSDNKCVEDAIHDVFVRLYSNRKKLPQVENIKLYLYITLKNELLNINNKKIKIFDLELVKSVAFTVTNVEEQMIKKELVLQKKNFLSQINNILSPRQKEAIYHRFVEQLSYKDISELMDIKPQSVKNIVQTAIIKIRETFPNISLSLLISIFFYI
ncbi:sigma-70 family RNA polymerase sigma factor [Dysgonomonas sp. Marseille-P4677]|uniref:RNA polymerase sigma factor n=1 Tax=Dysgonomonas sp. Marseille-P4677 TaxID=2364790 RepID=UPI0019141123|nr:sigma-70 family RNA polymerase sigma factor [Dysgonomonas sp. Marseille-P4677]MBK5721823.1 sigma-70 family RNA polymerase sigma factor [Dysgonomonas sp. Marseille-P4677]